MSDYDTDIVEWSEHQAALLRRRAAGEFVNEADLDWLNIAEEIESVGSSQRNQLGSRIRTIIEHLMKLEASPAIEPRPGWRATIRRERVEIEELLEDAPSLRGTLALVIAKEVRRAARLVTATMADYNETPLAEIQALAFTEEQVLGNWFPDAAR